MFEGAHSARVKTVDGRTYAVQAVVAEDQEAGIILLQVEPPATRIKPLRIARTFSPEEETVIVVDGRDLNVSDGKVAGFWDTPEFGQIVQVSMPLPPGAAGALAASVESSGSFLINLKGQVLGIAILQIQGGRHLHFVLQGGRAAALKPGRPQKFAGWGIDAAPDWLSTVEGLYFTGYILRLFSGDQEIATALSYFERALAKDPDLTQAWFHVGYCKDKLGRAAEVAEAYEQAVRVKPDFAEAYANLGLVYITLGRYMEIDEAWTTGHRYFDMAEYWAWKASLGTKEPVKTEVPQSEAA